MNFRTAAQGNARGSFAHFRYGFHAIPSLSLLHMHVISQDFISDSLKTVCRIHFFSQNFSFILLEKTLEFIYE
jgi:aprataxin